MLRCSLQRLSGLAHLLLVLSVQACGQDTCEFKVDMVHDLRLSTLSTTFDDECPVREEATESIGCQNTMAGEDQTGTVFSVSGDVTQTISESTCTRGDESRVQMGTFTGEANVARDHQTLTITIHNTGGIFDDDDDRITLNLNTVHSNTLQQGVTAEVISINTSCKNTIEVLEGTLNYDDRRRGLTWSYIQTIEQTEAGQCDVF